MLKEWLSKLFEKYTGKIDPAMYNFVYESVVNGQYSINEAEMAVKFSKEAKSYQIQKDNQMKQKDNKRREQVIQYVTELYRVYRKIVFRNDGTDNPSLILERDNFIQDLFDKKESPESLENLFELEGISKRN